MKYYIDYCTGVGNEIVEGTLEQAMQVADEGAAYTQQDIKIFDEDHDIVVIRRWIGVNFCNGYEAENPILFGSAGFYDDWSEF